MSDSVRKVACIVGSLLLCGGAKAITPDSGKTGNPYQGIVDRNVFGLKPAPPPGPPPEAKKPDLPPITLTGITTILNNKRALMNLQPPGKQVQSFILTEGQREGDLEVLEINEKAPGGGSVKVNHGGNVMTLTFDKNGPKLPTVAANPGAGAFPTPVANQARAGMPGGGAAATSLAPIVTRQAPGTIEGTPATSGANYNPGVNNNASMSFSGGPIQGNHIQPTPSAPPMTREEHAIMIEANHQIALAVGDGSAGIFPPSEANPTRNTTEEVQNTPGQSPNNPGQKQPFSPLPNPNPTLPRTLFPQ